MPCDNEHYQDDLGHAQSPYHHHLFHRLPLALIGANPERIVVSCNSAAAAIFASDPSSLLGRHLTDIFPAASRPLLEQSLREATAPDSAATFEFDMPGPGENPQSLAVTTTAITDDAGQSLGFVFCLQDVSQRNELERQLAASEETASLGTLASGVAHHFNNIIGGVATFVDFALNADNPATTRRALKMTAEAANRISHITQSLLTFAAKDSREFDLADLTEVVLTFSHLVENPLAEKNIKLQTHLNPVPIYEVAGSRMHQVLGNLLDNAELAMPNGGGITIELKHQPPYLLLTFSDTGSGITPEHLPHLFEPFFTTHGVEVGGDRSSIGLGLSVVQGIIHELGGTIRAESSPEKGATFTMRFLIETDARTDQQ